MKFIFSLFPFFLFLNTLFLNTLGAQELSHNPIEAARAIGATLDVKKISTLPVLDRGRIKPFQTLARESILFLTGKYSYQNLDAIQLYFSIIASPHSDKLELINLRDPTLRTQLGFNKNQRYFSAAQIQKSPLMQLAQPIKEKEERNSRSLEPEEKNILEAYNQYWFFKHIQSAEHFFGAVVFSHTQDPTTPHGNSLSIIEKAQAFLRTISAMDPTQIQSATGDLIQAVRSQETPELLKPQMDKVKIEILYNNSRLFFIAAILLLLLGFGFFFPQFRAATQNKLFYLVLLIPVLLIGIGFSLRVYITGFAPVTNMYGTMIWVAFGVSLFSLLLLYLYKNHFLVAGLFMGAAALLFITESLPIILSPDLDPIVAVLRSNLWLTIHVLTIVISYAAFTITMILGNIVVIRYILFKIDNDNFVKNYSQSIYRMTQLGVFLLSVGIILGGVWADYSWGRFWGWDPKETWSLIADIGYLAILHAKYIGWIGPFGIAMTTPLAYLLVVMAWYGVNFILASGLHSYGFSSGGATMVATFVLVQLLILTTAFSFRHLRNHHIRK